MMKKEINFSSWRSSYKIIEETKKDILDGKVDCVIIRMLDSKVYSQKELFAFIEFAMNNNCKVIDTEGNDYVEYYKKNKVIIETNILLDQRIEREMRNSMSYERERDRYIDEYISKNKGIMKFELDMNDDEFYKFNIWFNENIKKRKIEIIKSYFDKHFYYYDIILYENDIPKANITIHDRFKTNDEFKSKTYDKYVEYLNLPKLSECSELLKELYYLIKKFNKYECIITFEEWNKSFANRYSENDYLELIKEVYKLHLYMDFNLSDDELFHKFFKNEFFNKVGDNKLIVSDGILDGINNDLVVDKEIAAKESLIN